MQGHKIQVIGNKQEQTRTQQQQQQQQTTMAYRRQQQQRGGGRNRSNNNSNNDSNAHLIGTHVSVVQKHDQATGNLTEGIVAEILTSSSFHPRGLKVRLTDGTVGRISDGSNDNDAGYANADEADYDYTQSTATRQAPSLADFMVFPTPATTTTTTTTTTDEEAIDLPIHFNTTTDSSSWSCQVCTFANSGFLSQCEMCQTMRE